MRHSSGHHHAGADSKSSQSSDWKVIRDLLPYLLEYKFRVAIALSCLVAAKVANLGIPILMKQLIDVLNIKANSPPSIAHCALRFNFGLWFIKNFCLSFY